MFEIGFSELLIIAVVALVVLGPERLPRAAQMAGLWVRKARAQWYSMKAELERDLAADELKRSLHDSRQAIEDDLRATTRRARDAVTPDTSTRPDKSANSAARNPDDSQRPRDGNAPDDSTPDDNASGTP